MAPVTRRLSGPGRRDRTRRFLAAVVVLSIATVWLLLHAATALVVEHQAGPPDAIIMLASHEWERLPATAALARRYPAARVLVTVPRVVTPYTCHRCTERVEWLGAEGVAAGRVRQLRPVTSTYDEALAAREYAAREPFSRLAVVTTPYHTRRALATFRAVFRGSGVDIAVVPAAPAQGQPDRWWRHPYDRQYVRYEWAAILWYRWEYSVPLT